MLQSALDILTDENIAYISAEVERRCAENSDSAALLASLNAQLEEVQRRLKNIGNAIAQGIITETTKELLEEAEAGPHGPAPADRPREGAGRACRQGRSRGLLA